MNPALLRSNRRYFLFNLGRMTGTVIRRDYADDGPDPMKIHNQLPPNYKSFAGQMNPDQPAFGYDWLFKKQRDPTLKIPDWAYRKNFNPEEEELYAGPHLIWKLLSATFWGWTFWRLYWGGYNMLIGEPEFTCAPDPSSFTDAELGIPSDDTTPPRIYTWN